MLVLGRSPINKGTLLYYRDLLATSNELIPIKLSMRTSHLSRSLCGNPCQQVDAIFRLGTYKQGILPQRGAFDSSHQVVLRKLYMMRTHHLPRSLCEDHGWCWTDHGSTFAFSTLARTHTGSNSYSQHVIVFIFLIFKD